ncbi:MAG: endonuclease III [Candidatus Omnitrophica bacterium]|nr:endonuclease III [Candidatus Omnitrophota bacterium]
MAKTASPLPPAAKRIGKIVKALEHAYPDATCSLNYATPLELLVATILSAQCTDALVNTVTPALFRRYRTPANYAEAPVEELERAVARVNFYRNKAKSIKQACRTIVERFRGKLPNRMEDLVTLHGVARKTANVVLGNAFGISSGIVVDTHVMRLSQRLGLSAHTDRDKIEQDLIRLVPQSQWTKFGHQMIQHGRSICTAASPKCRECPIGAGLCPAYRDELSDPPTARASQR